MALLAARGSAVRHPAAARLDLGGAYHLVVAEWFSIEVFDGSSSARAWREAYGDAVVAAGHTGGMSDWTWYEFGWGVVLEVELPDEFAWERFLAVVAVRAALDAVPDPVGGLLVHRGRGGSAGVWSPRRPRPLAGAGAVALPEPDTQELPLLAPHVLTAHQPLGASLPTAAPFRADRRLVPARILTTWSQPVQPDASAASAAAQSEYARRSTLCLPRRLG